MKLLKSRCLVLVFSLSVIGIYGQTDPPAPARDYSPHLWKDYLSAEGFFIVKFPGEPKESQRDLETKFGKVVERIVEYGKPTFVVYKVNYREYPKALTETERKNLFDEERDKLLKTDGRKANLINDKDTNVKGLPARLFAIEYDEEKLLRVLYIVRDKKHYVLSVETYSRHGSSAMGAENGYENIATSFLYSIQFTTEPPRKGVTTIVGTTDSGKAPVAVGGPVGPVGPAGGGTIVAPPPKVPDEFDDKAWKEYADERGEYKILAIGSPKPQTNQIETAVGKVEMFMNIWQTGVGEYGVTYVDYPVAPFETEALKAQYDIVQNQFVGKYKLISQKDFVYEGYTGRELVFESLAVHLRARLLYVGNRLYQVIFATRPISGQSKFIVDFVERTANKFFNSFKLTNQILAKAENEVKEAKAPGVFDEQDIYGKFEKATYINDVLGLSLTIPSDWHRISEDETGVLQAYGQELMLKDTNKAKSIDEIADKNVKILFTVARDTSEPNKTVNLILMVERLPYKKVTLELYVKSFSRNLKDTIKNVKSVSEPVSKRIAGKDFYFMDAEVLFEGLNVRQRQVITLHKGVAVAFAFTYLNEKELSVFEQILVSLKFN